MTRSNRFAVAIAAAAMWTTFSAPVVAQLGGTSTPNQRASMAEEQRAFAAEQQRQQAAAEAQTRAMLERDLRVGNMTQAQQDQLIDYARERVRQSLAQAPAAVSNMQASATQFVDNTRTNLDRNSNALDPANADNVSNRDFSQAVASTGVDLVTDVNNMRLSNVRDLRPVVLEIGAASRDIALERQRIIESNNVSAAERQRVQGETQRVTRAVEALPTHLDEAEFRIRTETQRIRERETQIAQQIEQTTDQYGRDPANIPPGGAQPRRYPVTPSTAPTPSNMPPPGPAAPPSTVPPASTPPRRTAASGSSTVQRGTIPGDPDAGLTVPRSQGGTGAETAETRAYAQSQAQARAETQARADAQAQAERNAERTEQLRQQAMARARGENQVDNDPLQNSPPVNQPPPAAAERAARANELGTVDPTFDPPSTANGEGEGGASGRGNGATAAARAASDAINRAAAASAGNEATNRTRAGSNGPAETEFEHRRRHFGLGRVGAGEAGGSGSASGGSSDYEALAALPGLGRDAPSDMSVEDILAMIERSRVADENYRLYQNAARQNARDTAWEATIRERFGNGAWDAFGGGALVTTLEFEDIYRDYDLDRSPVIPPMRSLSAAGNSLSAAGRSLSAAGTAVVTGFDDYNDPAVRSLYEATRVLTTPRRNPYAMGNADTAALADRAYSAGTFQVQTDRSGRRGRESGGYIAASLFDHDDPYLRQLMNNGRTGLDRLLAQPFNVILTWGQNANDLDLHMTGPLGEGVSERFHIYYSSPGDLEGLPYAALIKDCICTSGSEVILTSALNRGGVYRVSVFNYGDQSANSTNLANASEARIQIVRGGTTQSVGNGTTIVGGRTILDVTAPNGQFGNTWTAVELDPRNGRITVPRLINQSTGSGDVP
jgi:hypothetical protein